MSAFTPPEFINIKNSESSFLIILYSGKLFKNLTSFSNKSSAIAVFENQGLFFKNKLLDVLKIFFL